MFILVLFNAITVKLENFTQFKFFDGGLIKRKDILRNGYNVQLHFKNIYKPTKPTLI